MNSHILIIDTRNGFNKSEMHDWWLRHKRVFFYPKQWGNSLSLFMRFLHNNTHNGILLITESGDMKNKVKRLIGKKVLKVGGICAGDMVLYDTPISAMLNDEVLWWEHEAFMQEEEFIQTYTK